MDFVLDAPFMLAQCARSLIDGSSEGFVEILTRRREGIVLMEVMNA